MYQVIFNIKKGCYTVVSEIAKRTGKFSSELKSYTVAASALAVLVSLGGIASVDATNYVNISGTEGSISASASKGMFGGSKEFNFNSECISVTGTDYAGNTKKNTTIQDGKVRVSNAAYGSEHYTEIDGGSVRTENLKVVPTIKDSLEFKQGGLVVRSEDSRFIVSKNGIDQSVDNGRGQSNSVKVKQNGTVFRTTNNGATGATETVIAGETIAAGDIVINGENGQSTITGLTNTTVDTPDFATQGRAATEEQLSAVRKEIKNNGTIINQQITNIDNRVNTVETNINTINTNITDIKNDVKNVKESVAAVDKKVDTVASDVKTVKESVKSVKSVDSKVTKVDTRVTSVETKVSTIDTNVTNLGKEVKANTEILTAHTAAANNRFVSIESNVNTLGQRVDTVEIGLSSVNQRVSNLDSRVNKVGAGAAALAALHPASGDGIGIYNGQKAEAIGGSYSPNDMTTISVGGAVGNGENMVNAGVSLKVGAGNAMSKAQMNNQIKSLQAENSALKAKDVAQDTQLQELRAEIAALKASMTK
ncbi:ESPR-type extended signal peptide-containing protein [uncultured Veillonella sp.]|uniref:ESPR-type extended signal peptide-containing protein n=1 Tax=uncultured Veillonella sp. TaxID=159268 RepID=UPI0026314C29|nr:ESPR-type extended signal peptide-containing protein [uncultured Veillonella sp.]